ncbi:MAG: GTPase domain-containing protein [Propionibacteriaceae bacterium]|nr:GTPase domain-containing protein [Propionibacteriaceae bacterium]
MTQPLSQMLTQLRHALGQVHLSLPLPNTTEVKTWVSASGSQLDDYIIPRLSAIEAPLLTVVGGSTGAGKSTLVNSILRQVVTTPGVIRPTTKAPVLIHHPNDTHWFSTDRVFPELARSHDASHNPRHLQVVASDSVSEGMAILDAPDIDSIDEENRALADQLLAAADLWLFVTSAARYADAVPWNYLEKASQRSAAVAVVVNRVPPAAMKAVPEHLAQMMMDQGLGDAPLFAVPEIETDDQGILPLEAVEPVRAWVDYLASNQVVRAQVVMGTLDGAIASLEKGIEPLAQEIREQTQTLTRLTGVVEQAFTQAQSSVISHSSDGSLLRGEVMARWQDYVGTGDFMRSMESRLGRARDKVTRFFKGQPDKALDVQVAVKSGLEVLIVEAAQGAAQRVETEWRADPAGRFLMELSGAEAGSLSPGFQLRVEEAIRLWQDDVLNIVSSQTAGKRTTARLAALGVNGVGVSLMLVAFAHTAGVTGAEIGIAGGTAVVGQKVLEMIFGDEAIRQLATTAGESLTQRVEQVFTIEREHVLAQVLDSFPLDTIDPDQLLALGHSMSEARVSEMTRLAHIVSTLPQSTELESVAMEDTEVAVEDAESTTQEEPHGA